MLRDTVAFAANTVPTPLQRSVAWHTADKLLQTKG